MQIAQTRPASEIARHAAYGTAAVLLIATALELALRNGGWWQLAAFGIGSDLALFAGFGAGLETGRLHPRAVPLYNALHSYWAPALLALAALALPGGYLVGALAWAFHISLDRAIGYGKRTPEGFPRA
jgi:hypothetical protein